MELLFKNAWILFLLVNVLNFYIFKRKAAKFVEEHPEKEKGYQMIFNNFLIFGSIPWIIVGIGTVSGFTNSIFDYFQPSALNPMVLLFHFSIILIWILMIRFIFFRSGAEFLENHPGIIRGNTFGNSNDNPSAVTIKIIIAAATTGGIIAMILMWTINFPVPKL